MTYSHNFGAKYLTFNSSIGSYYINELRDELIKESIDIGN